MKEIDEKFKNKYDFFYLPIDFQNKCNLGYAFINMISKDLIKPFYTRFHGKKMRRFKSKKICCISFAEIQGRDNCYEHFQNSTLMKKSDNKIKPFLGKDKKRKKQ